MARIFGKSRLPKIGTNDTVRRMEPSTATSAINRATTALGSQLALAKAINAPPAQISQWANGLRPVPAHHCLAIERATSGAVTRAELRPDDYWLIWPDLPAPAATQLPATAEQVAHG